MKKNQTILVVAAAAVLGSFYPFVVTGKEKDKAGLESRLKIDKKPVDREGGIARSYANIVEEVNPSVVSVYTATAVQDPYRDLPRNLRYYYGIPDYDPSKAPKQNGVGSGVIISEDGFILTNHHVAGNADEIKVYHADHGRSYDARLIGSDKSTDIAVIKIDVDRDFKPITIADSEKVRAGDVVLAFGSPFGLDRTVSMGIVSAVGRNNVGLVDYGDFIQTDASINRGNSGGALVDADGRLVGINNAIFSLSGGNNGIGFAIPANLAVNVASQLMNGGEVERGYLGILMQGMNEELAEYFKRDDLRGVLVARVESGSPADEAGFETDDLIMRLDGEKVNDIAELRMDISSKHPGTRVTFTVLRDGKERDLKAELGRVEQGRRVSLVEPRRNSQRVAPSRDEFVKGVVIENITPRMRVAYRLGNEVEGVIVTSVDRRASDSNRRLRPGDIILEIEREKTRSVEEAMKARKAAGDEGLLVRVRGLDGNTKLLVLD